MNTPIPPHGATNAPDETPVKGLRTRADLKRLGLGLVSILMALFAA